MSASVKQNDPALLRRVTARAFAQMITMIHRANVREDAGEGDPKVGGHPAACASSLEILAALHLAVREAGDYVCCKPHASPVDHTLHHLLGLMRHRDGRWFEPAESEAVMDRLRSFSQHGEPVFQSYHAESDPDSFHMLPSGSVGIPPVVSVYLALAHRYGRVHGFADLPQPHFWSLMGDSEFREGSLMEVLPEVAERELGNVTWIVDYNRQNLDGTRIPNKRGLRGTDAQRIQKTCEANGWHVEQVWHGSLRKKLFAQPRGRALRAALEEGFTDYHYQSLLWKRDAGAIRAALLDVDRKLEDLLGGMDDAQVLAMFEDLGGHDLDVMTDALTRSKQDPSAPTLLVAHTIKGRGLRCQAASGNHSALPEDDEVLALQQAAGLDPQRPYQRFAADTPEGRWLEQRGAALRAGIEAWDALAARNRARVRDAIERAGGVPESLGINLKLAPLAHTQWMWGQCAAKLVRIGVHDELQRAGRDPGRELTEDEARWETVADCIVTMAPDVGTSTNINPAMDEKIYGPESEQNWEKELDLRERLRPELAPTDEAWTRHIRFEIAEANCMSAAGSFGKMGALAGVPFLPMMTVYDFFIKRALDQLYYDLYWGSGFVLVGTPSGVTLAPEGAQHSWKSDLQIPNLVTWEPAFVLELDWILCESIRRHFTGENQGRSGVLVRAVTRALRQDLLVKSLRRHARNKRELPGGALLGARPGDGGLPEAEAPSVADAELLAGLREHVLAGGYHLLDWRGYRGYEPGENVVDLLVMGALVPEAAIAAEQLLAQGIYANVIVVTSPDLLLGINARKTGYRHLRETLGLDGALHLKPAGEVTGTLDAVDLAGRRVPIVSVHDGEEGLLDNAGSIAGVRQWSLAVRKFSKSGTPAQVYGYHGLDPATIVQTCGQALAETALERVRLSPGALAHVQKQQGGESIAWRELWPDPVQSDA